MNQFNDKDVELDNKGYAETPTSSFKNDVSTRSFTELYSKLEELPHGETLRKFVVSDKGSTYGDGDFSVEIHGLVDGSGNLYIVSEKVTKYNLKENVYEEVKKEK